jgi:hypothetical protein
MMISTSYGALFVDSIGVSNPAPYIYTTCGYPGGHKHPVIISLSLNNFHQLIYCALTKWNSIISNVWPS